MTTVCKYLSQNDLLLSKLLEYYKNEESLNKMLRIITGETKISLRIIDWFVTNYAKQYYTLYEVNGKRFKVYLDYKLKLKAYSKKRFDPFCRWEKTRIPYKNNEYIETTLGQLNFFKWAIENKIIDYIEDNYKEIEKDQYVRNSKVTSKKNKDALLSQNENVSTSNINTNNRTRKKREELSVSAIKSVKKEEVQIIVQFN